MSDVAARLSEGAAAVAATATYVAACDAVGRNPRRLSPAAIEQSYFAEDGLDLAALDADIAALLSAAAKAADALSLQRQALEGIGDAWRGESGSAAAGFVTRQCAAGARVLAAVQDSTEILGRLRTTLAARVAEKVGAAIRIDDRTATERAAWLAAARAVLGGAADDSATEVVTAQIAPYVDADIGAEWMGAMVAGTEGVSAAYRQAAEQLAELGGPPFEIATPPPVTRVSPVRRAASAPSDPGLSSDPAPPSAPALPATPALPSDPAPPSPAWAAPPGAAAAMPTPPGPLPDSPSPPVVGEREARRRRLTAEPPEPEESERPEESEAAEKPERPEDFEQPEDSEKPGQPAGAVASVAPEEPVADPEPLPQNEGAPAPALPPPLAAEAPEPGRTPCEIAADELPQVGQ